MRPASSFLLSLLLFASIVGVQIVAMWPSESKDAVVTSFTLDMDVHEYGMDVLKEFEDGVEDEAVEFSVHRPPRFVAVNTAQEDRNELFGPPEDVALGVAHVWVPPQAHVTHPTYPWPDNMLRPPRLSLLQAGKLQFV